jgi:transcription termination/antitermination protein NusG
MSYGKDVAFTEGEKVRIKTGPFSGFRGRVESMSEDQRKLEVRVEIFGQRPPVEVFFLDVEKLQTTDYRKN